MSFTLDGKGPLFQQIYRSLRAEILSRSFAAGTRLPSTRLCNVDTVTMVDQGSQNFRGVVFLGDFVPYRRVRTGSAY